MASNNLHILSSKLPSLSISKPNTLFAATSLRRSVIPIRFSHLISRSTSTAATTSFTWENVVRVSQPEYSPHDSSDLTGFFERIKACNRSSEMQSEFIPFILDDRIVGYVHNDFVESLRSFKDVFVLRQSSDHGGQFGCYLSLNELLRTLEDRTKAVGDVIKSLGELIPGIRNELYPVSSSYGARVHFSLERAAAPYFGIKAYGVHMNGYVERNADKFLWIGKRSQVKPTFPGMLDHLVAGGLPHGISCGENIIKECEEEAGIPQSLSKGAIPVGAVSYMDIDGWRFKRDVLFCYDLKLPDDFVPDNQDGEVESFRLIPVKNVANIIRRTTFFKPNCSVVIIDFLFRHGFISPDSVGYLDLLQSLRSGDCS